ncbi:hypothetical protein S83_069739 [Arachis hypogaea]
MQSEQPAMLYGAVQKTSEQREDRAVVVWLDARTVVRVAEEEDGVGGFRHWDGRKWRPTCSVEGWTAGGRPWFDSARAHPGELRPDRDVGGEDDRQFPPPKPPDPSKTVPDDAARRLGGVAIGASVAGRDEGVRSRRRFCDVVAPREGEPRALRRGRLHHSSRIVPRPPPLMAASFPWDRDAEAPSLEFPSNGGTRGCWLVPWWVAPKEGERTKREAVTEGEEAQAAPVVLPTAVKPRAGKGGATGDAAGGEEKRCNSEGDDP